MQKRAGTRSSRLCSFSPIFDVESIIAKTYCTYISEVSVENKIVKDPHSVACSAGTGTLPEAAAYPHCVLRLYASAFALYRCSLKPEKGFHLDLAHWDWAARRDRGMARPRRHSSNLGADPRGDTSAPAISTLTPSTSPSFLSPVCCVFEPPFYLHGHMLIPYSPPRSFTNHTPKGEKRVQH